MALVASPVARHRFCSAGQCDLSCPEEQSACNGGCFDLDNSLQYCGSCDEACEVGEVCSVGECELSCPANLSECNGGCVDTDKDRDNCGACGESCDDGEVCSSGSCELSCQSGLSECGDTCVDLSNNPNYCGDCDTQCADSEYCNAGSCQSGCTVNTYVIDGVDSVTVNYSGPGETHEDNRVRAYSSSTSSDLTGWVLFDVSTLSGAQDVIDVVLRLHGEDDYGSPNNNPVVEVVYSSDDGWTRSTAGDENPSRDQSVSAQFDTFDPTDWNEFPVDLTAHNFEDDLSDGYLTLGVDEVAGDYRYVYFCGTDNAATTPQLEVTVCD